MIETAKIKKASDGLLAEWREDAKKKADMNNRILASGKVGRTRVIARRELKVARAEMRQIDQELEERKAARAMPAEEIPAKPRGRGRKKRETLLDVEAAKAPGKEPEEA